MYLILLVFGGSREESLLMFFPARTEYDLFFRRALSSDSFCKTASGGNAKCRRLFDPDITAANIGFPKFIYVKNTLLNSADLYITKLLLLCCVLKAHWRRQTYSADLKRLLWLRGYIKYASLFNSHSSFHAYYAYSLLLYCILVYLFMHVNCFGDSATS